MLKQANKVENYVQCYSLFQNLYLTLVQPILEYCCHVWDPFLHKDIELLESVLKFAFRVCTKRWREPHNHLRNLLKLPLLKDRRKKLKLTVVFKCLNGLMAMPPNICFPGEPFKLEPEITWKHIFVSAICTHKQLFTFLCPKFCVLMEPIA